MTDSIETQEILKTFNGYHELVNRRIKIAAVLRELVNQLKYQSFHHTEEYYQLDVEDILRIADELEAK